MVSNVDAPHVLMWEVTRACPRHCRPYRAQTLPHRDERELSLQDMIPVLDDVAENCSRPPVLVFTGGDPLERPDLDDIIRASVARHITTVIAPSVTPRLTDEVVRRWKLLGVHFVSLSLDGVDALTHDPFRRVRGTFDRTVELADAIVREGMTLQISTSIRQQTVHQVPAMASLVQFLRATSWELFFVIPTGGAGTADALSADQMERVLEWLVDFVPHEPLRITTMGAPQWSRVLHQRRPEHPIRTMAREARGVAFINYRGDVLPSGDLPVSAGNVRHTRFSDLYRHSELFQMLRDSRRFEGPCSTCDYRDACGGSRARAYAVTGNLVASDPGCPKALGG